MPQPMFECPACVQAAGTVCLLPQQHATLEAWKHILLQGLLQGLVPTAGPCAYCRAAVCGQQQTAVADCAR